MSETLETLQEWQPIETAPKDGTEVLLVWRWRVKDEEGEHKGVNVVASHWNCHKHHNKCGTHDCPNESDCDMRWGSYAGEMTHWMPLPDPPKEQP